MLQIRVKKGVARERNGGNEEKKTFKKVFSILSEFLGVASSMRKLVFFF